MKHTPATKALAVFMAVMMLVTGCMLSVTASDCDHTQYTSTWKTVTEPDCNNKIEGLEQKICDNCGDVLDENKLEWEYAHDYSAQKWVSYPTCTEKGEYYEKCIYCEKLSSYVVLIPNTHEGFRNEYENGKMKVWSYGADANWFTDQPATCTQPGLRHAICVECGKEIASEPIEALGHKSAVYDDWLDSTNDAEYYIGSKNVAYVAPTCTEAGSITFQCDVCGEPVRVFELEALGHQNAALEAWDYCFATDPDFGTDEDLIQYTSWNNVDYTPTTCTEPGLVTFKCGVCQTVMRTMTLAPLGHSSEAYDDYLSGSNDPEDYAGRPNVVYKAPTCTETGSVTFRCDTCKAEITTFEIAALGHTEGYQKVITAATCTTAGELGTYCGTCDKLMKTEEIAALGHTEGYTKIITAATCTTAGELGTYCQTCDKLMKTEPITALGHDYGSWYKNGDHMTHSHACSRCMFKDSENCVFNVTVTEATCTEGGYSTYVCTVCGDTFEGDYTDPLGHDFSAWTDDGTDTHTRTCSVCGETETAAHCWSEWTYNGDARFFKNGTKTCVCEDCGASITEEAKNTAWICHLFYPIILWLGSVVHKVLYVVSFSWFLPCLNIQPKM